LTNTGVYSGVTTDTLTITGATTAMNGYQYAAVFTNGTSPTPSVTSTAALLTVNSVLSITPTLPQGVAGVAYTQTLSVVGNKTPFTVFSVNSFNPGTTGLTLSDITTSSANGTIVITGTPTAAGTATFTVNVADTGGDTLTQSESLTIRPPLSITTPSLPNGTAGSLYNQSITVAGGVLPFTTFSVTNFNGGTTGLTASNVTALPATGVFNVKGTPSAAGTVAFTVNVTDSAGNAVTQNYKIIINPPLAITPSLPAGTANTPYSSVLTVTGGGVPYTSLTVSNFSAGTTGLTAGAVQTNTAAGTVTIKGTPTAAGTVTFTVNVADAIGAALSKQYTLTINPGLALTPALPKGTAGANYDQTLTVTGGTTPFTTFTFTGFNAGTTGLTTAALTVNASAGTVVINGTPSAAGTMSFTLNATDSGGAHLTQLVSVIINPALSIGNLSVTQWTAGLAGFKGVMTISGGTGPFTLVGASGLPAGLTAVVTGNTIGFVGTPTSAITTTAHLSLHDAAGASFTKAFGLTINPAPSFGNPTGTQWTAGIAGFVSNVAIGGGTGGLSLASLTGLPTGVTATLIGNTIHLTGKPTTVAKYSVSAIIRDGLGVTATKTFVITINATPTLGTLTKTQWDVGDPGFSGVIPIAGGTGPFTISSASGLPTGLTAVVRGNAIGFIGTPTVAQTFAAGSITLHDATGASVTRAFSIKINPALVITTTSLPASRLGLLYAATIQTTGGTGPVTFAITAGSLPPGMKLSSTGVISGASRGMGSFTVTITVTDAVGFTRSKQYTILLLL
jgi:hypothetical protein